MACHPVIFFFENLPWFLVPALWAVRFHKKAWGLAVTAARGREAVGRDRVRMLAGQVV